MQRRSLPILLILALAFSSVGFTVSEWVCPMKVAEKEMASCPGCTSPKDKSCCEEIVKHQVLTSEFERVARVDVAPAVQIVFHLALTPANHSLSAPKAVRLPAAEHSQPPAENAQEKCVRTTVILI